MSHPNAEKQDFIAALQWHVDHGVDVAVLDQPVDRTAMPEILKKSDIPKPISMPAIQQEQDTPFMGSAQAIIEAQKLAAACNTLEELAAAIQNFDGLSIKKTATNMVFAAGKPESDVMVIGDAPATDEDIQAMPFVGETGQLCDKILACIALSRHPQENQKSVYLSNILNWRPPGNRTPTDSEIAISLPFIEKHIELVRPKILIFFGGVAGNALLKRSESISKLRGNLYDYFLKEGSLVKTIVTYHPAYLLKTPAQKKAVWADMLMVQDYIENNL